VRVNESKVLNQYSCIDEREYYVSCIKKVIIYNDFLYIDIV
jgi:hypothetical protein